MFILSFFSIIFSSYLLASIFLKNQKNNLGLIYIFLIAFAQIVLSFEILSLLKSISTNGVLICNLIFFVFSIFLFFKTKSQPYIPQITKEFEKIKKALKQDKILSFLYFCFIIFIISKLFETIIFPVMFGDALGYYLPRALTWIQQGSIEHFVTPDTRELIMPVNMEFLYCWVLLFLKNEQGIGIFSFFSFIGAIYTIYNLLGELGFCRRKKLWSVFVFSSFAIIANMAKDPCADLFIGSLLLTSIYLFYCFIKYERNSLIYFSTLAIALAIGTKTTAIIATPSVMAIMLIILWKYKKELFKKTFFSFAGLLFVNLLIFSAYNYILNFIQFGNFISCQEQFLMNKFRGGIKGYLCNLIKYIICIFDFSGIEIKEYHNFMNMMQIKLFSLIGETPASYTSKRFVGFFAFTYSNATSNSALGVMGLFAFLPALILAFSKKLQNRKFLLFLLAISILVNILIFSRVMVFTEFNIRYIVTFFVIASPIIVFSYIKSNKNIFKWILTFIMFIYLVSIPHKKPLSYILAYNNFVKKNPNIENPQKYILNIKREEKKIFEYIINNGKCNVILLAKNPEGTFSDIEKLILHGFRVDKIFPDNYEAYNLENYKYIITEPYKIISTNIQTLNAKHCLYEDNDKKITTDPKKMASVECLIPFEYFYKNGFKKVENLNLKNYVILEK